MTLDLYTLLIASSVAGKLQVLVLLLIYNLTEHYRGVIEFIAACLTGSLGLLFIAGREYLPD